MFNGKMLEKYLKENKITNVALAKMLGVSEGAVRHIIVGIKQPSLAMATELAHEIRSLGFDLPKDIINDEELVEAVCRLL